MNNPILDVLYVILASSAGYTLSQLDIKDRPFLGAVAILALIVVFIYFAGNFLDILRCTIDVMCNQLLSRITVPLICLDIVYPLQEYQLLQNILMGGIGLMVVSILLGSMGFNFDDNPISIAVTNVSLLGCCGFIFWISDSEAKYMKVAMAAMVSVYGPCVLELMELYGWDIYLKLLSESVLVILIGTQLVNK